MLLQKCISGLQLGAYLVIHMMCLHIKLNVTATNVKALYGAVDSYRELWSMFLDFTQFKVLESSKLVFVLFSRLWLVHCSFSELTRSFSWNFYLLCIKLVGLTPSLNISPVDKMILKKWTLLLSQKPDDECIYGFMTIPFQQ